MKDEDDLVDRQRGFLTEHDREYLLGYIDEMTDNYEQQKRYQIRQRFRHAMLDFYFISDHLSDRDKRLLWPEIDDWLWRAQNRRQQKKDFEYPDIPFLLECWRDIVSVFVESHILMGIPEAEQLAEWIIEEGVNKGVRRKTLRTTQMYREVDANLDWGIGGLQKLMPYLERIADEMPAEPDAAEEYLLSLVRQGYLTKGHSIYLYENNIEN